jgi:hypothetical protein
MAIRLSTVRQELRKPSNKLYLSHPIAPVVFGGGGRDGFGTNFSDTLFCSVISVISLNVP